MEEIDGSFGFALQEIVDGVVTAGMRLVFVVKFVPAVWTNPHGNFVPNLQEGLEYPMRPSGEGGISCARYRGAR